MQDLRVTVSHAVTSLLLFGLIMLMSYLVIIFFQGGLRNQTTSRVANGLACPVFQVDSMLTHCGPYLQDASLKQQDLKMIERLERYESDLNEYMSTSPSLVCRTSFVGSAKYADTIVIDLPKMSNTRGSGRRIKGGKELAMERQEKRPPCGACGSNAIMAIVIARQN